MNSLGCPIEGLLTVKGYSKPVVKLLIQKTREQRQMVHSNPNIRDAKLNPVHKNNLQNKASQEG